MAAAVAATVHTPTAAQTFGIQPSIRSDLTWTSNADFGTGGGRNDTILTVQPRISMLREGTRLRVEGSAAVSAIGYANNTLPSRLQPEADVRATLEAIQRTFFIDAGLRSMQASADPFGPRPEIAATSENSVTVTQANLSPRLEGRLGRAAEYRLRSQNSWTRDDNPSTSGNDTSGNDYFGRHTAMLFGEARPFGWRLEAERSDTRFRDPDDRAVVDVARATLDFSFGPDLTVGVHGGRERTRFSQEELKGNIYGVHARWQPSPRTDMSLFQEHRFFGNSWRLGLDHRMRRAAWHVAVSRTLDTRPQTLFDLPATENVVGLLNNLFLPILPDALERARAVEELIASQGLPTSTLQPIALRAQRLSIVTLRSATVALNGVRNTVTLTGFQSRTEDVIEAGALATLSPLGNNQQHGASVGWSYRLTPTAALTASADWTRIRSLETVGDDRSTQKAVRLRVVSELSARTTVYAGMRWRDFETNAIGTDTREGAVFAGFGHLFQ